MFLVVAQEPGSDHQRASGSSLDSLDDIAFRLHRQPYGGHAIAVVRLGEPNDRWSYTKIVGEKLHALEVARTSKDPERFPVEEWHQLATAHAARDALSKTITRFA